MVRFKDDDGVNWNAQLNGRTWLAGSLTRRGIQFTHARLKS